MNHFKIGITYYKVYGVISGFRVIPFCDSVGTDKDYDVSIQCARLASYLYVNMYGIPCTRLSKIITPS